MGCRKFKNTAADDGKAWTKIERRILLFSCRMILLFLLARIGKPCLLNREESLRERGKGGDAIVEGGGVESPKRLKQNRVGLYQCTHSTS
jgi:hypothetical protein